MLEVRQATVHYGYTPALRGASLMVNEGEIVTMIGANGAGKSTLLNAIVGLVPLRSGEILLRNEPMRNPQPQRLVAMGVGLVPEGRQLFAAMSVLDNLLLGAYSLPGNRLARILGPLAGVKNSPSVQAGLQRVFGLFPVLEQRQTQAAGSLSGGEQQMLAIGRALMAAPRILLLDEPSIGLAPQLVLEIMALLRRLRDDGITILLVEQDAIAALRTSDRGYVMERGRIVVEGIAHELLNDEKVRHAYLGKTAG
jgi:branched-chain amino acid transport system ATP-binding protein